MSLFAGFLRQAVNICVMTKCERWALCAGIVGTDYAFRKRKCRHELVVMGTRVLFSICHGLLKYIVRKCAYTNTVYDGVYECVCIHCMCMSVYVIMCA